MSFSDLVRKLDEIALNPNRIIDAQGRSAANPYGNVDSTGNAIKPQPAQTTQPDPQTAPGSAKPIPGQQPNLDPKPTAPVAPTKPTGAEVQQQPPQQPQQAMPAGLAAAILQAVNANKQPQLTPTSSQSIAQQQQAATQPLQQTAKPGEPTEEEVNEWGDWGGKKEKPVEQKPAKVKLNPKQVDDWVAQLKADPNTYRSPNWSNVDPESKQQIVNNLKQQDPVAYDYLQKIEKVRAYKTSEKVDPEELAKFEKERDDARSTWNDQGKVPPNKVDNKQDNKQDGKQDNKQDGKQDNKQEVTPKANVSSAELQQFRTQMGNPNITLGQYLNYKNKLSAVKGGANDPEVIQKQLGNKGTAWNPEDSEFHSDNVERAKKLATDLGKVSTVDKQSDGTAKKEPDYNALLKTAMEKNPHVVGWKDQNGMIVAVDKDGKYVGSYHPDKGAFDILPADFNPAQSSPAPEKVSAPAPAKVVEPAKADSGPTDYWRKILNPVKVGNRTMLDPFRTTSATNTSMPADKVSPELEPGAGPAKRAEPMPVKENLHIQLQAVVDDILGEDATIAPHPSTWEKTKGAVGAGVKAAKDAIPQPVRNVASKVANSPVTKIAGKAMGPIGAGVGLATAPDDFLDADDLEAKGDKVGAWLKRGQAAANLAMIPTTAAALIPSPMAPGAAVADAALGLTSAGLAGAEWVRNKYFPYKGDENPAKEEFDRVLQLTKRTTGR